MTFSFRKVMSRMIKQILHPSSLRVISYATKRNSSTSAKLTSSYYHHVSSLPLIHKTLGQVFDETAKKYPEHECFIFKGMLSFGFAHLFLLNSCR